MQPSRMHAHRSCRSLFNTLTHAMRTMPAATSFWIFSIITGDFRCACAALGFSWKSCSTCGEVPARSGQSRPLLSLAAVTDSSMRTR